MGSIDGYVFTTGIIWFIRYQCEGEYQLLVYYGSFDINVKGIIRLWMYYGSFDINVKGIISYWYNMVYSISIYM